MPFSDRELLARMIMCEAGGEGDNGMRAVASVIMNRAHVQDGEYFRISEGGNIRNIMLQKGQFNCAVDFLKGKYNPQNIYNMNPTDIHYEIADWAIAGGLFNVVDDSLWFMNPYKPKCPTEFPYNGSGKLHTRVNEHCFYSPTNLYSNT